MDNKYKSVPVKSSEITSYSQYLSRRDFLRTAGLLTGSALLAACSPGASATAPAEEIPDLPAKKDELGDPANSFQDITNYNNFYEFSTDKEAVNPLSQEFTTEPWTVEVYGLVNNPKPYGIEDLLKLPQEERVYRLRCVEAWSMVIPWTGFPLASLLKEVEPTSDANYVRFETVYRPEEMPGQNSPFFYPWPYQEGLRLDEATNDLTILGTGWAEQPRPT